MDIILSKDSKKFIERLDSKFAKQIAVKIKALGVLGHTHDAKKLKGSEDYYRADIGEYRIIYKHEDNDLIITLVGKRNDDEVYIRFKRKKK